MFMKLVVLHQRRQRSYVLVKVPKMQSKGATRLTSMHGCIFKRRNGIRHRRRFCCWHHGHFHAATSAEDKTLKQRRDLLANKQNKSDDSTTHKRRQHACGSSRRYETIAYYHFVSPTQAMRRFDLRDDEIKTQIIGAKTERPIQQNLQFCSTAYFWL